MADCPSEGAGTPIPLNTWEHVALVCDGQNMRLYRNGMQVGTPVAYNAILVTLGHRNFVDAIAGIEAGMATA